MLALIGHFRFPAEHKAQALPLMHEVIVATRQEAGCRGYSYAEDVTEPGLFHVTELWDDRAALDAHFASEHMRRWSKVRDALGFCDRHITLYELGASEQV